MRDMRLKNRHPNQILDMEKAEEIRALAKKNISVKELAIRYGVSKKTVYAILEDRIWKKE